MNQDLAPIKNQPICFNCVGDEYVSASIETDGKNRTCSECSEELNTLLLSEIATIVDRGFQEHFQRTASEPNGLEYMMIKDKELGYDWYREGEAANDLIAYELSVSQEIADNLHIILADQYSDFDAAMIGEETEYGDEVLYEEKAVSDNGLYWEWQQFERTVLNEARFFSEGAKEFLDGIFDNLTELQTRDGKQILQVINPEDTPVSFYRGRVFHHDKNIQEALERPDLKIGPPPSNLAGAGRMNPKNISVFYGATHPKIALSELRPPVGSTVVMGEFEVMRPLKLLNLKRLQKVFTSGSVFDPQYSVILGKTHFLKSLVTIMTRPTNPNNSDAEYLPTQLIADYLANANSASVDGILYPSSQTKKSGMNVVLFRRASKVEEIIIPEGTEITTRMWEEHEDGADRSYSVVEWVPSAKTEDDAEDDDSNDIFGFELPKIFGRDLDSRDITLRVKKETLHVHIIEATKIKTDKYRVRRNRYEKRESGSVLF